MQRAKYISNGTITYKIVGEQGPQGPQEEVGQQGPVGPQGPKGETYDDTEIKDKITKLSEKINFFVTPEMFGAKGDGVTDDTEAVQKAIDYAHTNKIKKVVFADKTYCANIIVYNDIELVGNGKATIKSVSGSNKDVIKSYDFDEMVGTTGTIPTDKGIRFFSIKHLIIDGNMDNNTSGYGIKLFGRNLYFFEVFVKNCASGGIYTEFGTHNAPSVTDESFYGDLLESVFERIKIYNCKGNGWTYKGPHDSHIKYLICVKCDGWAFYCTSGGVILENINTWFVSGGCYLGSGGFRLMNCQIDGGGYDGSDHRSNDGIRILDDCGNGFIKNTTIAGFNNGVVVGGLLHMLDYNVRDCNVGTVLNANNCILNVVASMCDTAYKLTKNGSFDVSGYIYECTNVFEGEEPKQYGNSSWRLVSNNTGQSYIQYSVQNFYVNGWNPSYPKSNKAIIAQDTAPTHLERGGVLMQDAEKKTNESETMTGKDFNYIIQLLEWAGLANVLN